MIFAPEMVRLIAAGRKTQTRRPVQGDEPKSRYRISKTYAVQPGRGRPASLRIAITDVRRGLAGDVTLEDARAEGFRTTDDFRAHWATLYDRAWLAATVDLLGEITTGVPWPDLIADERLQRLGFTERALVARLRWLERHGAAECIEGEWWRCEGGEMIAAGARFNDRHAHKPVWVLTFRLDTTETPRFLAARPGGAHGDYVSTPALSAPGEPQPVSEHDQALITARAGMTTAQWRALEEGHRERELRMLSLEERIVRARRTARLRNVDIEREMWLVERLRQQGRTDEAVIHRLRGAERKIYREAA